MKPFYLSNSSNLRSEGVINQVLYAKSMEVCLRWASSTGFEVKSIFEIPYDRPMRDGDLKIDEEGNVI